MTGPRLASHLHGRRCKKLKKWAGCRGQIPAFQGSLTRRIPLVPTKLRKRQSKQRNSSTAACGASVLERPPDIALRIFDWAKSRFGQLYHIVVRQRLNLCCGLASLVFRWLENQSGIRLLNFGLGWSTHESTGPPNLTALLSQFYLPKRPRRTADSGGCSPGKLPGRSMAVVGCSTGLSISLPI